MRNSIRLLSTVLFMGALCACADEDETPDEADETVLVKPTTETKPKDSGVKSCPGMP